MSPDLKTEAPKKSPLHATKIDLSEKSRAKMVEVLNTALAGAIDLHCQAKQAHWNVKGPQFIALHELFDTVATVVEGSIDTIAERAVILGGTAQGTVQTVARRSNLPPYPTDITTGADHVDALSTALAAFGKTARAAIDTATEAGDADTADLFTGLSRDIDKHLWFVEAHQQARS